MKKIFFSLLPLIIAAVCYGQPKIVRSTASNTVYDTRHGAVLNMILPVYTDTVQANIAGNIGIDSCGAVIFTYKDNKIWKRACSPKHWESVTSVTQAGMGMTRSTLSSKEDTLHGGGTIFGIQRYYVPNPFALGHPFGYMQLINRPDVDSLHDYGLGTGGRTLVNEGPQFVGATYAPAMFSMTRHLAEWARDTLNLQYGGLMSLVAKRVLDSVNSRFGAIGSKKPLWLTDPGIAITNQIALPKDTLDIVSWQDGVTGSSFHSIAGIGSNVGYRAHVAGWFPWTLGFTSTMDLQRESSRHTIRRLTGNGFSSYTSNYRSWQQTMTGATPDRGHYIANVWGYTDMGNTDTSIGPSLSKAQILLKSEIDSSGGIKIHPQWRPHNEVRNGYGIWQMGDSDVVHFNGFVNLGPQLPTHQNGLWPQYRFQLWGDGYVDGSLWFNKGGRIVGGNTSPSTFQNPNYFYFVTPNTDSSTIMYFGTSGAVLQLKARYVNDAVQGGADLSLNIQHADNAAFRVVYYNNTFSIFERRYRLERGKFFAWVRDSISFQAPAYKLAGMPTGAQAYVLMQDANGYTYKADTTGLFGGGGSITLVSGSGLTWNGSDRYNLGGNLTGDVNINGLNLADFFYNDLLSYHVGTNGYNSGAGAEWGFIGMRDVGGAGMGWLGDRGGFGGSNYFYVNDDYGDPSNEGLYLHSRAITDVTANNGDVWTLQDATTGKGEWAAATGGSTPTWQQVLTAGSTLTGTNTPIVGSGGDVFSLVFGGVGRVNIASASTTMAGGASNNIVSLQASGLNISGKGITAMNFTDSLFIQPYLGKINIDSLRGGFIDTVKYKPMGYSVTTGDVVSMNSWAQVTAATGGSVNIYNTDDALTGNRTLNGGDIFSLTFSAITAFHVETVSGPQLHVADSVRIPFLGQSNDTTKKKVLSIDVNSGALTWTNWIGAGGAGTTDHAALSNLAWTASGHTGANSTFAAFNGSGAAIAATGTGILSFSGTTPSFNTTSASIAAIISDETGSGALTFATTPTFTTNITSPLVIGGTSTTSDLTLQTTTGVGTTGADFHILVGNNGATEAFTILNSGNVGIGVTGPVAKLDLGSSGAAILPSIQTTSTGVNGNFITGATTGMTGTTTSNYLFPGGAGTDFRIGINGTTSSTSTAGRDIADLVLTGSVTTEAGSSTHPRAGTLFVGSKVMTNGAGATDTLYGTYFQGPATGVTAATGSWNAIFNRGDVLLKYGSLTVGFVGNVTGVIKLAGSTSGVASITVSATAGTPTFTLPTVTGTLTQKVEGSTASSATPTPAGDAMFNFYDITALAADATFAAPSGTPANHNMLTIRIKDNSTVRALAWNAIYRGGVDIALPTTTVDDLTMYIQFIYNSADSKWDLIGLTSGL